MMPNPKFQRPMPGRQQGAALVIGLFILLIASFLAVASLNNATVQERMASNSEKVQKALRAAESAVEDQVRTAITDFSSFSAAHGEYGKTNPNWPSEAYDIGDSDISTVVQVISIGETHLSSGYGMNADQGSTALPGIRFEAVATSAVAGSGARVTVTQGLDYN